MKKTIKNILVLLVITLILSACSSTKETKVSKNKLIYATFFPVADLTKRIVKDKFEVKTIIDSGQEPHSFELKINDMKEINSADLIIYNGANMESFILDLEKAVNNNDKFLDLSQGLTLLSSSEQVTSKDSINPHTWLSIKNAVIQLDTIYQKVSSIDPENEAFYKENLIQAQQEFNQLDLKFEEALKQVKEEERYFVVSHAAFNYLADDYNLKQVAVTGISPEDEPSAKQLKEIADFVKKHQISTIFFEGKATPKVAETLAKTTGAKTSTLYTMETLSEDEAKQGYLKLMELNLKALVESFNE